MGKPVDFWERGRGKKWGQFSAISVSKYEHILGSLFLGEVVPEETSKAGIPQTVPSIPKGLVARSKSDLAVGFYQH